MLSSLILIWTVFQSNTLMVTSLLLPSTPRTLITIKRSTLIQTVSKCKRESSTTDPSTTLPSTGLMLLTPHTTKTSLVTITQWTLPWLWRTTLFSSLYQTTDHRVDLLLRMEESSWCRTGRLLVMMTRESMSISMKQMRMETVSGCQQHTICSSTITKLGHPSKGLFRWRLTTQLNISSLK